MEDYRLKQLIEEQLKYDKAKTRKVDTLEDHELAKLLQAEFNQDNSLKGQFVKPPQSSQSLIDPSWELIDPTPNIHNLFIAFNATFFWKKLGAVCVSWSKRMTSCAGICSYQGRGGLCSITLSEPLLKLRPRKDLVETLLHEMIHAYLFVTHNNKDRDGHGPEFHKHMYRINNEAGTKITVYHSFHDEVKLYQQHWWKCNGPCQHKKPFYGMVRRAMNRAPGPNDRWWAEHSHNCGGTFVKVREPEKKLKNNKENHVPKTSEKLPTKNMNNDIRNFFPANTHKVIDSHDNTRIKNINTMSTIDNSMKSKQPSLFQGNGIALSSLSTIKENDYGAVRKHWLDKFDNNSTSLPKRQKIVLTTGNVKDNILDKIIECDICGDMISSSKAGIHEQSCLLNISISMDSSSQKECLFCNSFITNALYDMHVASCAMSKCDNIISKYNDKPSSEEEVNCLVCKKLILKSHLNKHLDSCVNATIFIDDTIIEEFNNDDDSFMESIQPSSKKILGLDTPQQSIEDNQGSSADCIKCPVCSKRMKESLINTHLDICLS